jgi:hypothetical protein
VGALAAFVWNASPVLVYVILRIQFPLKGVVCFIRYLTGKWLKVISVPSERSEIPSQAAERAG